jgi:hypothetical protein
MTGPLITRAQHESHQSKLRAAPPQFSEPKQGPKKREKTVQNHGANREEAAPNYEETGRRRKREQRHVAGFVQI